MPARHQTKRKGAAAVEFAVVAPFLIMLFFGMVEFGRAMMVLGVITNASRGGARAGTVTSGDLSAIKRAVTSTLERAGVPADADIEVKVNGIAVSSDSEYRATAVYGATISVRVSIPYAKVSWLPNGGFFLADSVMTETAIMRREG